MRFGFSAARFRFDFAEFGRTGAAALREAEKGGGRVPQNLRGVLNMTSWANLARGLRRGSGAGGFEGTLCLAIFG